MRSCRCRRTLALSLSGGTLCAPRQCHRLISVSTYLSVRVSRRAGHIIIARPPTTALPYFTDHIA